MLINAESSGSWNDSDAAENTRQIETGLEDDLVISVIISWFGYGAAPDTTSSNPR